MFDGQNIGAMYDAYLSKQADEYYGGGCEGEPQIIDYEREFERYDEDGNVEYSESYTYSCEYCDCTECEHWKDFHEDEWTEMQEEEEEED